MGWLDAHVESTSICEGQRLVLNGAGVRKRGYFKANVVALYLPEKLTLAESVYRLNGMRRLQLHVLRDFTSSTISRMLIADFQRVATDAEFKQLIPEVAEIGRMYGEIKKVQFGDVVTIDWVPGKGMVAWFNDRAVGAKTIKSELAYQIYLRMFIGTAVPEDLRNALLGLTSRS